MDLDGDLDLASKSGCICRNTTITQCCEEGYSSSLSDLNLGISPNPFSSFVSIQVSGYTDGSENLQIFDLSGRLVAELKAFYSEGTDVYHWNGESSSGVELPSGIYTARLCLGDTITTATMLKLE